MDVKTTLESNGITLDIDFKDENPRENWMSCKIKSESDGFYSTLVINEFFKQLIGAIEMMKEVALHSARTAGLPWDELEEEEDEDDFI